MIRFLWVLSIGVPATIWCTVHIVWATLTNSPNAARLCADVPRAWSRLILRVARVDVVLENEEFIDPEVPQVLVVNHVSWFDVPALAGYVPGPYVFVAKKEVGRVPFFGRAVRACGHILIDRQDRSKAVESLAVARERLEEQGPTIIMFPEGTRSANGELQPFKKGAFVLAIQTGADVIPAAIEGSREVMPKGSFTICPGTVRIRFGEPIPVGEYTMEDRNDLTHRAREALAGLLNSSGQTNRE